MLGARIGDSMSGIEQVDGEVSLARLAATVRAQAQDVGGAHRYILGIAGPPAAGKSTLAGRLRDEINAQSGSHVAEIAPMDGFHLTNQELAARGDLSRKGEPDTFDAAAYAAALCAVRSRDQLVGWPTFDRVLHDPTRDGVIFDADIHFVITEGNYLLLDQGEWSKVRDCLDDVWYLDDDLTQIADRLLERHMKGGRSRPEAVVKISSSDMPNARLIASTREQARMVLEWTPSGYRVTEGALPFVV
jgi:pantothenate kinase